MGVRLHDEVQPGNVIPLRPNRFITLAVAATTPEPAQLYDLIVLAYLLHVPEPDGWCQTCGHDWPCQQVRLAYRLREGF
jgi:hypothetical protein